MHKDPICPHCDYVISIEDNELFELYCTEDEELDIKCPSCKEILTVEIHKEYSFTTLKPDEI